MKLVPLLVLVLLVLSPSLPAQEAETTPAPANPEPVAKADVPLDIMTVSPAELVGVDTRALIGAAHLAYNEKRYEDSARAYIKALKQNPGDSTALYNLACCYGLLGAESQAVDFLKAAYTAGFRDVGHIRNDADFEKVRASDAFVALLDDLSARVAKEKAAKGDVVWVPTKRLVPVRIVKPADVKPWERLPLVIGLHGMGDNAERYAELFSRRGVDARFYFAVPDAPYAFAGGSRIGYSWYLYGDEVPARDSSLSHELNCRYVIDVLEAVKKEVSVDETRVFLTGFSQGGGMTLSVGLAHPELFRGLIPIGGWMSIGEHTRKELELAAKSTQILMCHSPEDRIVEFARAEEAIAHLHMHGVQSRLIQYDGGHTVPKVVLEEMVEWMKE